MDLNKLYNNLYLLRRQIKNDLFFLLDFFYVRMYSLIIVGSNILLWLLVYSININISRDSIVLHYNVDFGVDLIGDPNNLYIIPLLSLIVILVNFSIILLLAKYKNFKIIAHILFINNLAINIFLLISLAFIYLVNFR